MWRWSLTCWSWLLTSLVFSTCVEVIPQMLIYHLKERSILHVCGGDPELGLSSLTNMKYSPRVWRWSLTLEVLWRESNRILHVCGGDPWRTIMFTVRHVYSPRVWRWSRFDLSDVVESPRILHVCGGDPHQGRLKQYQLKYSPRVWRWS